MLCSLCNLDLRILTARYELIQSQPPAVALVQVLRCPQCGKTEQLRHPLALTGAENAETSPDHGA